jgi:hypothetical protein
MGISGRKIVMPFDRLLSLSCTKFLLISLSTFFDKLSTDGHSPVSFAVVCCDIDVAILVSIVMFPKFICGILGRALRSCPEVPGADARKRPVDWRMIPSDSRIRS